MSDDMSLRARFRADLSGNPLASILAVGLAAIAVGVFAALGMGYGLLFPLAVVIGVFVPRVYDQYWPSSRGIGYRVGWTVLMSLFTVVILLGSYMVAHHFIVDLYTGVVAFGITVLCQFGLATRLTAQ